MKQFQKIMINYWSIELLLFINLTLLYKYGHYNYDSRTLLARILDYHLLNTYILCCLQFGVACPLLPTVWCYFFRWLLKCVRPSFLWLNSSTLLLSKIRSNFLSSSSFFLLVSNVALYTGYLRGVRVAPPPLPRLPNYPS